MGLAVHIARFVRSDSRLLVPRSMDSEEENDTAPKPVLLREKKGEGSRRLLLSTFSAELLRGTVMSTLARATWIFQLGWCKNERGRK